jgi:hypothetical protein
MLIGNGFLFQATGCSTERVLESEGKKWNIKNELSKNWGAIFKKDNQKADTKTRTSKDSIEIIVSDSRRHTSLTKWKINLGRVYSNVIRVCVEIVHDMLRSANFHIHFFFVLNEF